jgi:acetolactate synthase-1/2/3 large subunit
MRQFSNAWKKQVKRRSNGKAIDAWWKEIKQWRSRDCLAYKKDDKVIKPQFALERLQELTKDRDTFITTEVGQHQMWAAQFLKFDKPNHWMTSGGLGTMGYGFPSALGVQTAHPGKLVIDVAGEASFMMNIQEISTAVQHHLPVKVFILNNQYLGMVRQWQELLHGGRYSESYSAALPDFIKLAECFGAVGLRATKPSEVDDVIKEMMAVDNMVIADIMVDQKENCYPMIPSGSPHNEMILGSEAKAQGVSGVSDKGKVLV